MLRDAIKSRAAAMAEADTGLAGGCAGCCCAAAGNAETTRPRRPASTIASERFILFLLEYGVLRPLHDTNSLLARQHRRTRKADEKPMLRDAGNRVERLRQMWCIHDAPEMGIDDPVAAIGDKSVAVAAFSQPHFAGNAAL